MANEEIVRRNRLGKIIRNLKFETRTYLKEMAGFRCAICKEVSSHLEVDHIRPLWDGGTDELENLQVLCYECHKEKSREEHHRWSKLNPVLIIRVTNGN
jgi:5-methylcytosine-specific restriction endonuclease McrA